jgi:hypothetical protein
MIFKELDSSEIKSFKDWAWDFYKAGDPISELWHPVIQAECEKINLKAGIKRYGPLTIGAMMERFQVDKGMREEE